MESERLMRKWAARRGWDDRTKEMLLFAFLDELGIETLSLFDRFLATTAAGEDELTKEEE